MKQNYLVAYGRLLRYAAVIKKKAAVKVIISLGVNTSYVFQGVVMAQAGHTATGIDASAEMI